MRFIAFTAIVLTVFVLASAVPVPRDESISSSESVEDNSVAKVKYIDSDSHEEEPADSDLDTDAYFQLLHLAVDKLKENGISVEVDWSKEDVDARAKRDIDIPDVDLCAGTKSGTKPDDDNHDEYIKYKLMQKYPDQRSKRHADEKDSSEEHSPEDKDSSEENSKGADGAPTGKNAASATRRRHQSNSEPGKSSSDENTKEDKDNSSEGEHNGKDGAHRKRETVLSDENDGIQEDDVTSADGSNELADAAEPELTTDNSVDDYVQGCEVMEVSSDEANETTYGEDRRKRSLEEDEEVAEKHEKLEEEEGEDEEE